MGQTGPSLKLQIFDIHGMDAQLSQKTASIQPTIIPCYETPDDERDRAGYGLDALTISPNHVRQNHFNCT